MAPLNQRLRQRRFYERHRLRLQLRAQLLTFKAVSGLEVSPEWYVTQHDAQSGLCAICGQPERARSKNGILKALAIDHNGKRLRQLLCQACNQGLGMFGHDPTRLQAAIAYLERHAIEGKPEAVIAIARKLPPQAELFS